MFISGTDILILLLLLIGTGENNESAANRRDDDTCTMTELALPDISDGVAVVVDCKFTIAADDAIFMAKNYLDVMGRPIYPKLVTLVGPEEGKSESPRWIVGLSK